MHQTDARLFFELQKNFEKVPFSQSKGWFDYLTSQQKQLVCFVDNQETPRIACWGVEERLPVTGSKLLRFEGEAYASDVKEDEFRNFFSNLRDQQYVAVEVNSNNSYSVEYEVGIRRSGFMRPLGSFACPLTIDVPLQLDLQFNRNWKRNVKNAAQKNLAFKEVKHPTIDTANEFVALFSELADFKGLGYRLSPESLLQLMHSEDMRIFVVSDADGNPLAARIIHVRDKWSSDVLAANSMKARECGAIYLLMTNIFETLKSEGFESFDFGRIPPSNHATDSVYLFKNAVRGLKIQYNGEWALYKSKRTELLIFLYKYFKVKKQRY